MKEITLNNGEKKELSGQSLQDYLRWRKAFINVVGQVLAVKFPELYGKIGFNLQGGKFVNSNIGDGIKAYTIDAKLVKRIERIFDESVENLI